MEEGTYAVILLACLSVSGPCIQNRRPLSYQLVESAKDNASLVEDTFIIVAEAYTESTPFT